MKKKRKAKGSRKFEPRSQQLLEEVYKKRKERISSFGGKDIYVEDAPKRYRHKKENQLFIMALGFAANAGFHHEVPVHGRVGLKMDSFICKQRYLEEDCFRCEDQSIKTQEWRQAGGTKGNYPDNLTAMFPWDRCLYLVLDMTDEETMEEGIQLLEAPKGKWHEEVMKKTVNRRTGDFIDITDFKEGRVVFYDMERVSSKAGTYPAYSGFSLEELEEPIPQEYIDELVDIIEAGEEGEGTIEQFLYIPGYEEVKEAHLKELKKPSKAPIEVVDDEEEEFDEEGLREELEEMTKVQRKKFIRKNKLDIDTKGLDEDEVVDAIVEAMEEEATKPKCFGKSAYELDDCEECNWINECADETEE